ncbi:GNAT family N-acetyltransferase [Legionella yabuuchiae]|uniref:GNAT family N-acetyltransferase n=1 Tax=Legionella yabuuchiae TaxID=376727 RepID=UPI0010556B8F|nr:GNAT family N-acetyltransferase [Legionella yabuuchiae]
MNIEIRSITEHDIEQFRQAVGCVAREKLYLAFLDSPSLEMTKEFVLTNIKESWPQVVAISYEKIIGWCDIVGSNRHACKHLGTLGMGIINEFRGHGIGHQLIKKALELAKEKGLTRIELSVREDNKRAIHLYKKFGFNIEGKHINSLLVDGQYFNQISMALLIYP